MNLNLAYEFIVRQFMQIKKGGFSVLCRKAYHFFILLFKVIIAILFVPFAIIIRIIAPLKVIRIGKLISQRLGHFAFEPELYLCERDIGLHDKNSVDIFYCSGRISNSQLKLMWARTICIIDFIRPLDWANRCLPSSKKHVVPLCSAKHEDPQRLLDRLPPHLCFTFKEEKRAIEELKALGLPEGEKFICFHTRDSLYLDVSMPMNNWRYHDYRDSSIHNYIEAVEALAARNYYVLRMGFVVKDKIHTNSCRVIDYAFNGRNDFMDIYLLSKCHFLIAANSGPCAVTTIFRRPNAFVNVAPFMGASGICRGVDLFIPKKYWLLREQRFMTFNEILRSGAGYFDHTHMYEYFGIKLIENSPEEIRDLAIEMEERLKGTWNKTEENEYLQKTFLFILDKNGMKDIRMPRIGTAFLHDNEDLLIY
jgi:putative glycosyltransferase (TIGR04372 family)